MKIKDLRVTVVGGATGGASAALLLANAGASVTLFEKIAEPKAVGAGIGLAENGLAVLDGLGVLQSLERVGKWVHGTRIVDGTRRTLLQPPSVKLMMVRRSELYQLLLDGVAAHPRIETRFGVEVTSVTHEGEVNGANKADLVVAADGAQSAIRTNGNFGGRVRKSGISYLRGLISEDLAQKEEAWASQGLFGSFPVSNGTYFFMSAGSDAARAALTQKDLTPLREAWSKAYAPAGEILARVQRFEDLLVNEVIRIDCERWSSGAIALLGDAAHAMGPNLGQGANSALVDAAVLTDELSKAADLPAALRAYETRRKKKVRQVADVAGRLGSLAEKTSPGIRWVRDKLLLPIAQRIMSDRDTVTVLQETPADLVAIARR